MKISVVVCTYNRCESLKRTLKGFSEVVFPEGYSWELVLVDNNSKDETKIIAEEFKEESGLNVKYVFEAKQGLSYARNRGINHSKGEVIAFTDDDVMVDRYWLSNIERAFEEHDVSCVGGKILPVWEIPKPKWLKHDLHYMLALLDYGDKPFYLRSPIIWGANFSVKADIFGKYGGFDTNLGRIPGRLFAGEETEFARRILNEGEKILYDPNAVVYHYIPSDKISKRYFRKWKYDQGILRASLRGNSKHKRYLGIPYNPVTYLVKNALLFFKDIRYLWQKRFLYELRVISLVGFILKIISDNKLCSRFFRISI
jgi:glycosyltransferase involved in cell wall biosynthesis